MLSAMSGRKVTSTAEEVRKVIRDAGLRVTAPRVAVMLRVEQTQGPVTHADIADALSPQGWDRATIYRNLTDLTEAGLLRRTDMGDHVWRFELAPAALQFVIADGWSSRCFRPRIAGFVAPGRLGHRNLLARQPDTGCPLSKSRAT